MTASPLAWRGVAPDGGARIPSAPIAGAPLLGFAALLGFVAIEYLRPQDWIGPLEEAPVGVAAAAALGLCLLPRLRAEHLADPAVRLLGVLAAMAALWVPFATNRFWAFQIFQVLVLELLAILGLLHFVDRPRRLHLVLALLLVTFVVEALWGIAHAGRGLTTHFGDENDLALGVTLALPFAVYGFGALRSRLARLVCAGTAVLVVTAVVASASRGGLVALVAAVGAMVLFARHRLRIAAVGAVGALLFLTLAPGDYWADMATMFDPSDPTRAERIRYWEQATAVWVDHPVLGVGPGNIPWVIGAYDAFDTTVTHSIAGRQVHSLYFTLLPEWGLVGVVVWGALFLQLGRRCAAVLRRPDDAALHAHAWTRAIVCSVVACAAGGLFLSIPYYPHLYYLLGLAIAIHALQRRTGAAAPGERPRWARALAPAAPPGPPRPGAGPLRPSSGPPRASPGPLRPASGGHRPPLAARPGPRRLGS